MGAIGIALPSIIAILIIAMFFQQFKDNYWVGKFFMGVRPAVVALIAAPCFKMAKTANINRYNIWIPVVCCLLIAAFGISPIYIIIALSIFLMVEMAISDMSARSCWVIPKALRCNFITS